MSNPFYAALYLLLITFDEPFWHFLRSSGDIVFLALLALASPPNAGLHTSLVRHVSAHQYTHTASWNVIMVELSDCVYRSTCVHSYAVAGRSRISFAAKQPSVRSSATQKRGTHSSTRVAM